VVGSRMPAGCARTSAIALVLVCAACSACADDAPARPAAAPATSAPAAPGATGEAAMPGAAGDGGLADSSTAPAPAALALEGGGLRLFVGANASARPIAFGTAAADVRSILDKVLGGPGRAAFSPDCNADVVSWKNGLNVYFSGKRFAGWSIADGSRLTTMNGIGVGSRRVDLEGAYAVRVDSTSLGAEFTTGELAGLLSSHDAGAMIIHLWSGATCIAR